MRRIERRSIEFLKIPEQVDSLSTHCEEMPPQPLPEAARRDMRQQMAQDQAKPIRYTTTFIVLIQECKPLLCISRERPLPQRRNEA